MKLIYNPETKSFSKIENEGDKATPSPYDWNKINASGKGSGIFHYTDAKGFLGVMKSGFIAVSNGGAECFGSRKPVVWLTKSDFKTSSIAIRKNTDLYTAGINSNGFEYSSMLGHHLGQRVEIPKTVYITVRFEICENSIEDGSVKLTTWAKYKETGFAYKDLANAAESGNRLMKADPQNSFMLSYADIPIYCLTEPKVMKNGEWVSIRELDSILNSLPEGSFIDARVKKNGRWILVKDIPNDESQEYA